VVELCLSTKKLCFCAGLFENDLKNQKRITVVCNNKFLMYVVGLIELIYVFIVEVCCCD
jgi:hypothetical protein